MWLENRALSYRDFIANAIYRLALVVSVCLCHDVVCPVLRCVALTVAHENVLKIILGARAERLSAFAIKSRYGKTRFSNRNVRNYNVV